MPIKLVKQTNKVDNGEDDALETYIKELLAESDIEDIVKDGE